MHLGGLRIVPNSLFKLCLSCVEPSDNHEITAKNLMGLRVPDIELERLGQRLDGLPYFPQRELAIPQGVPTPGGFRMLLHISGKKQLDILKPSFAEVIFELVDKCWLVCSACLVLKRGNFLSGQGVTVVD